MVKLADMEPDAFKELLDGRFVTKKDLECFATKDELKEVAKEASEHSTSIIKTAAEDAVKYTLISVGIDPTRPTEMQETMAALRNIVKTKETDKNTFRGTIIKISTNAITMFATAGFVLYLAKLFKVIK